MYKKNLFAHGAKSFLTYRHKSGGSCCGSGIKSSNIDNYLLGLVKGVNRMSIGSKPKSRSKGGKGLKFSR